MGQAETTKADEANEVDPLVAALVVLARHGVPTDIQEMLVKGSDRLGVRSGALPKAIEAVQRNLGRVMKND